MVDHGTNAQNKDAPIHAEPLSASQAAVVPIQQLTDDEMVLPIVNLMERSGVFVTQFACHGHCRSLRSPPTSPHIVFRAHEFAARTLCINVRSRTPQLHYRWEIKAMFSKKLNLWYVLHSPTLDAKSFWKVQKVAHDLNLVEDALRQTLEVLATNEGPRHDAGVPTDNP